MVRSVEIAAVVVGLALTGFVEAQSSSPAGTAAARPHYILVTEQGRSPQRCKVLKTWNEANGDAAFQVQAVDTGELMTIVSSNPQSAEGARREMPTRIFRWGSGNKPPEGTPLPPPTAAVTATPPAPPAPVRAATTSNTTVAPVINPQPLRPAPSAVTAQAVPAAETVRKSDFTTAPVADRPVVSPYILTNNNPSSLPVIITTQNSGAPAKPLSLTPMGTPVIQYQPSQTLGSCPPAASCGTSPRLVPMAGGAATCQNSCNCACPQPCDTYCKPCDSCSQSSCVCSTPSPMRQPFISRLFKSNSPSTSTATAAKPAQSPAVKPAVSTPPATTVAKTTTEPAKPGDWRESWGEVKPWKAPTQANSNKPVAVIGKSTNPTPVKPAVLVSKNVKPAPVQPAVVVSKRADPPPVILEPAKQPTPLNNPDHYRDLVMNARPSNSKIPQEVQPPVASRPSKPVEETMMVKAPPQPPNGAMPAMPPPDQPPSRMVQIAANEPNAFWSPQSPADESKEKSKNNAFDREEQPPPQGIPPATTEAAPAPMPRRGPVPLPPRGPMLVNPPRPPVAPMTPPPGPPRPMSPDTGVPESMGNAFTLSGTRRPIPADFGGTPQEPNGFDPPMQMGQGSPPIAYGMGAPGTVRPPMPNMAAINPYMNVPPTPANWQSAASEYPVSVRQSLAALKDSLYPSERESAAEQLSELDWRHQPLIVEGLMKSARDDPAATVRAACIHALAHMKVDTTTAVTVVRDLKSDRDPRVRQEAEEALHALGESDIQQASHK